MDKENYINIQGWMKTELGLTGQRLMVYAIVYGFCQDGESSYTGGLKYIMDWCGCCKNTARTILHELTEEGLIEREDMGRDGQIIQTYRVAKCYPSKKSTPPKFEPLQNLNPSPSKNSTGTPPKIGAININKNINRNKRESVFTPPTLDEVRAFWRERPSMTSDPDHFYLYFDEADWKYKGGRKMKDWHKAALMWEKNEKKYGR